MNFTARIRALRKEKKESQVYVAEVIGLTVRQYQRYERGEQEPNLAKWIFLADLYNVSLDYLVGRSDRRERL